MAFRCLSMRLLGIAATMVIALVSANCGGGNPSMPTPPGPPNPPLACGVERWFVKTLADPDASQVNPAVVAQTSISALNALPSHSDGGPDGRVYAEEFRVFEVSGRVIYIAHEAGLSPGA